MKKTILAVILILFAAFIVFAQNTPIDLIVLLDISTGMSSSYEDVNNYLTGTFLSEFLRVGDTFHFITFSNDQKLDIARRINGIGDVETLIARMMLQYPIETGSNVSGVLNYTEQYVAALPARPKKIVLVSVGDPNVENLVSTARQRLNGSTTLDYVQVNAGRPLANLPNSGRSPAVRTTAPAPATQAAVPPTTAQTQPAQTQTTTPSAQTQTPTAATPPVQAQTPPSTTAQTQTPSVTTTPVQTPSATTQPAQTQTPAATTPAAVTPSAQTQAPSAATQPVQTQPVTTPSAQTPAVTTPPVQTTQTMPAQTSSTQQEPAQYVATQPEQSQTQTTVTPSPASSGITSGTSSSSQPSQTRSNLNESWFSSIPFIIALIILALLILGLIIFFASRKLGSSPSRAMSDAASLKTASAVKEQSADHSKDLARFASNQSRRTTPYDNLDKNKPVEINPNGPVLLNLFVDDQNTNIGKRNIHSLKSGYKLTVGGGKSDDFLIFLVPMPSRIGEIRRNGSELVFTPYKPKYFPDIGSSEIRDCINKTIRIISDKNYEMRFRFEMYEDPLIALNRILMSVNVPI
ncbi:MAG: hypothetical protein LBG94_00395 [Treponema sp.]|jgi:hypothetical protein|nr:hypothetical protein [Treponema sp.]